MQCVNCGRENVDSVLLCYWCGLDPTTGEQPHLSLDNPIAPPIDLEQSMQVTLPPPIEVPAPLPISTLEDTGLTDFKFPELTIPEMPDIQVASAPDVTELSEFKLKRRRATHRPIKRPPPSAPKSTRPALPSSFRWLVFGSGLFTLLVLGLFVSSAALFSGAFCTAGFLFAGVFVIWAGLLLARVGRQTALATGLVYEKLQVLGHTLRASVPGMALEIPLNLPKEMDVADLPVAFSQLRFLANQGDDRSLDLAVDLLTGAIVELVARDNVILARRSYPLEKSGLGGPDIKKEIKDAVLIERRAYTGPGQLEARIMSGLHSGQSVMVEDLVRSLVGNFDQAMRLIGFVTQNIQERPPDLDALTSPDDALAEWENYRQTLRQTDPEIYDLLQAQVRQGLKAAAGRPSWADRFIELAQSMSAE